MKLNIKNETGRLRSVVLGQPNSMGGVPTLDESYDAKSYYTIEHNNYPKEEDIINEMNAFEAVLKNMMFRFSARILLKIIIRSLQEMLLL